MNGVTRLVLMDTFALNPRKILTYLRLSLKTFSSKAQNKNMATVINIFPLIKANNELSRHSKCRRQESIKMHIFVYVIWNERTAGRP
jgi:hypothetical protein